jgi:vacuolar iron transporter family protein
MEMPKPNPAGLIEIAKAALKRELTVLAVYRQLAKRYRNQAIAEKLEHFAEVEAHHADFWRKFLSDRQINSENVRHSKLMVRLVSFFFGIIGLGLTLKLLEGGERKAINLFALASKSTLLSEEVSKNSDTFLSDELAHEEEFIDYSTRFRVFVDKIGIIFSQTNDGLVIVISTALGLAGVYNNPFLIGTACLMVAIAASLNTAASSYFFVRTELRIKRDILKRLKLACSCAPEMYQRRIEKYMRSKNYDAATAKSIAAAAREKNMLDRIIAEEEFGITAKALGDPKRVAFYSGVFKIIGTALPLIPLFAGYPISVAIPISIIITIVLLAAVGSIAAIAAEIDVKKKVLELTTAGLLMSLVAFLLGNLANVLTGAV